MSEPGQILVNRSQGAVYEPFKGPSVWREWYDNLRDALYTALGVAVALIAFFLTIAPLVVVCQSIDRKSNPARYGAWCKVHGTNVTFKEWETLYDANLLTLKR